MQAGVVSFQEGPNRLRISWDNRTVLKDRFAFWFLLLFWIVWAPATVIATAMIFISDSPLFFTLWCVFGWTGTIAIPITFMRQYWQEWIEVDAESISWGAHGPLAPKTKKVPTSRIAEVGFGRYPRGDHESVFSLNVYESRKVFGFTPRHMLAYWVSKEHKEIIFERIQEFVLKRSIPLKLVVYRPSSMR
jgi:hypothetical protein